MRAILGKKEWWKRLFPPLLWLVLPRRLYRFLHDKLIGRRQSRITVNYAEIRNRWYNEDYGIDPGTAITGYGLLEQEGSPPAPPGVWG